MTVTKPSCEESQLPNYLSAGDLSVYASSVEPGKALRMHMCFTSPWHFRHVGETQLETHCQKPNQRKRLWFLGMRTIFALSETMKLNYGWIRSNLQVQALHERAIPSCSTFLEDNVSSSIPVNENAVVLAKVHFKSQHSTQHSLGCFKLFTHSTSESSWTSEHGIHTGISFRGVHPCSTWEESRAVRFDPIIWAAGQFWADPSRVNDRLH